MVHLTRLLISSLSKNEKIWAGIKEETSEASYVSCETDSKDSFYPVSVPILFLKVEKTKKTAVAAIMKKMISLTFVDQLTFLSGFFC